MKYLGLWHVPKTKAPYICIEPWSSLPSRQDIVEEFENQSDLISLPSGETYNNPWVITIE
jgi:galactose mutarotase-like enzyme